MSKRPNVLFICSDQHSKFQLGCYGNPYIHTPVMDGLAERGTRFNRAYSINPICVPARAGMSTGRFASQLRTWDNASPYTGQAPSFGHRLLAEGVKVTTVGKLHFRNTEDDTGFPDQRIPLHIRDGIGDLYGTIREPRVVKPKLGVHIREAGPGESSYIDYDQAITREALAFLDGQKDDAQPWMLYLGYTMPHLPLICPQEFWDMYEGREIPMPAKYRPDEMPMHEVCRAQRHYMGLDDGLDDETVRRAVRTYYGMCSFLDRQIGVVLNRLRRNGQEEDTIILYTTDHGEMLGNQGMWYKSCMFEPSAGIPLIIAGPGVPQGRAIETTASLVDIYPTILDFMNVPLPEEDKALPGRSLLAMARDEWQDPNRPAYCEFFSSGSVTSGFMVRSGDYKYVYYVGCEPMLFNLVVDPFETRDLAGDPGYAEVQARMDALLRRFGDPEAIDRQCRADQDARLELYGGREQVFSGFATFTFSPAPKV